MKTSLGLSAYGRTGIKELTECVKAAEKLGLDPSLIASRAMLTRLGLEEGSAWKELMPWQRDLLDPR